MTSTEEIVVCGEDFIERRIFVCPNRGEIENLQRKAHNCGYTRGWRSGFVFGLATIGSAALFIWLVMQL
jgi:hypothetical protein